MAPFTTRPVIMGRRGVVTSGHYLATVAGLRIMEQGGNAIDASAAMGFCLALLEPQSNGIGGEVPTLIYSAKERRVYAISGVGWTPAAFTIEWCREHGIDLIPGDGYLPACVPAVVGTWATALAPHKRPRATLTPSLVLKDGEPFMVFGTPGGDCQDQWTLQFFLNYVDFGMTLQEALDAPTVHSLHFPSSFYPREAFPGRMVVEGRIPQEAIAELERRGHEVVVTGDWVNGKTMAIHYDGARGVILGACAPKGITGYALGW